MSTDPRRAVGARGEALAREHLVAAGYAILDANFRTRHGELDLVAADRRALVFCEVKTRVGGRSGAYGPFASIGAAKRRRLRAMAREWLGSPACGRAGRRPPGMRFDAIGIRLNASGELLELEHLEDAF